ncbi:S-methyl-5'-thioinosine phosphorylase [Ephemeroptericola cinctiostellae]|uniref:Probable 6-oxopurine nucleoside phosphorylase n=2 Tax=Ephemeroptericola cinctiostellae TaxID=2268024 RepID=A0A345DDX3_9BURK|nr:S-methyl-5'-thioinosine phosphorylase [Ephemeroptericola cinctiostellae]
MLGVIAGSGLQRLAHLENIRREIVRTPFGETSCALTIGELSGVEVVFLNRHGYGHTLAPHQINYRANVWALQKMGVDNICAIGSTGSMMADIQPGQLVIPDDVIDYTSGRVGTYFEGPDHPIVYTDLSEPFDRASREVLLSAANRAGEAVVSTATYACTNGPRLETRAEVKRMAMDGAHVVGMTLMPEAALAKELDLPYAAIVVCTNYAAGVGEHIAHDLNQWRALREQSLIKVENVLLQWVACSA